MRYVLIIFAGLTATDDKKMETPRAIAQVEFAAIEACKIAADRIKAQSTLFLLDRKGNDR